MTTDFAVRLSEEMSRVGWTQSDLARHAGISQGSISNVLNGQRKPGVDFVLAVARALGVKPEDLYRTAGLLPAKPAAVDLPPDLDEVIDLLKRLPSDERKEVLMYTRFRYQQLMDKKK